MIIGIGIDSVEIARFAPWASFPQNQLLRIFHPNELAYCFAHSAKTAERLAARFAAREACFKALSAQCTKRLPFLTLCKAMRIENQSSGAPELIIDWIFLSQKGYLNLQKPLTAHLSLTHTQSTATAFIILESR